jgi:hypothetical protein
MNGAPTWQRGLKKAGRMPGGYGSSAMSSKVSEYVINQQFTLVPFKMLDRSSYLYAQPVFAFGVEYQENLTLKAFQDQWDHSAKRQRLNPEVPWTKYSDGGQQGGEAFSLLSLPMINWALACFCMEKKTNSIPTVVEIVRRLKYMGVCITQESAGIRSDQQPGGGPDVRAFTLSGETDIYQIFKGGKRNGVDQGLMPGTKIAFALKPTIVPYVNGADHVDMNFYLNGGETCVSVTYKKPVVWTIVPMAFESGEVVDFVKEGLQIFRMHEAPDYENEGTKKTHVINLRGHYWRLGTVRTYADPAKSTQLFVGDDFPTNANQLQRSAKMTIRSDWLAPQSIIC